MKITKFLSVFYLTNIFLFSLLPIKQYLFNLFDNFFNKLNDIIQLTKTICIKNIRNLVISGPKFDTVYKINVNAETLFNFNDGPNLYAKVAIRKLSIFIIAISNSIIGNIQKNKTPHNAFKIKKIPIY